MKQWTKANLGFAIAVTTLLYLFVEDRQQNLDREPHLKPRTQITEFVALDSAESFDNEAQSQPSAHGEIPIFYPDDSYRPKNS